MATSSEHGLDLLAVEARCTTPHLETAGEVCLREAEQGRRVGFVFLNVGVIARHPVLDRLIRAHRLKRVRALEHILQRRGVTILPAPKLDAPTEPLNSAQLGIDSLEALARFRQHDAALGLGALSSLISFLMDTAPEVARHRELIDRLLNSAHDAFLLTRVLLEQLRPASVLVFNGRLAYSKGIAEASRLAGMRVLYHETSSSHERYYVSEQSIHSQRHAREMVRRTWERATPDRRELAEGFFSRTRGRFMSQHAPYLAAQRTGQCLPRNGRRRLVYFVSSIDEFAAVEEGVAQSLFPTQFAALEWLAAWTRQRPDTELIIRFHPRMIHVSPGELARWRSHEGDQVTLLLADSAVDSYALADSADRVVTFHSTLGVEATYQGNVSILVGDSAYRGFDCVYEPGTLAELDTMLTDDSLKPKPRENCLPYAYWLRTHGEPYRYYQPISRESGRFAGQRLPANHPFPLPARLAIGGRAALRRLHQTLRIRPESVQR